MGGRSHPPTSVGKDAPYEIVHYDPALKPEIARIQTHLLSPDPELNARYFHWKYERNPYADQPLVYLAMLDGHVVAMRGLYGSRWELGRDRQIFAPLIADDLVVAPDHRNRRLVSRVMTAAFADAARRGFTHLLNLSGGPVTVFGSLAMGWRSAGTVNPVSVESDALARWRRVQSLMRRMRVAWRFADQSIVRRTLLYPWRESKPYRQLDSASTRGFPISVERAPRPDAMADLVEALGHDGRLRHVRDRPFFDWRFANPVHEYRFVFWGSAHLEGYLVLQRSLLRRGGYRVQIVDLEAADAEVRANLVHWTVRAGRFPELFTWSATALPEQRQVLADAGFTPADIQRTARGVGCVLVRRVGNDAPESAWTVGGVNMLDLDNWDLRLIYSTQG